MMGNILGFLAILAVLSVPWLLLHGAQNNRIRAKDDELEEWEGVTDVKRKTRDKLASDPDYAKRVQNEFND